MKDRKEILSTLKTLSTAIDQKRGAIRQLEFDINMTQKRKAKVDMLN